ncbi:MAG: radical SAM protein [Candidatus Omnitrophota bacterium]
MKLVFAYKNRYHVYDSISLEYLSAIARARGHRAGLVYDQDIFGTSDNIISLPRFARIFADEKKTLREIISQNPDAAIFLDGATRRQWNKRLAASLKEERPKMPTILFTDARVIPGETVYDYILAGEPEYAATRFFDDRIFTSKKDIYRFEELADLDALPAPDKTLFSRFVNFSDSYLIYTGKGCAAACAYCQETLRKENFGQAYIRRRSPETVIAELIRARANFKPREIIYKDAVFTADPAWLARYLALYRENIGIPYKCFAKADTFTQDTAHLLKESNCYCVEFGVQTFNERLKKEVLHRPEGTRTLLEAFALCERLGISYDIDHLFGIPGETEDDLLQAAQHYTQLRGLNRIKCHNLTVYPGSALYSKAPSEAKSPDGPDNDFFSGVPGEGRMRRVNRSFQNYFKMLPLIPRPLNRFIIRGRLVGLFRFIPRPFTVIAMALQALKQHDRRFYIYARYYPRAITNALKRIFLAGPISTREYFDSRADRLKETRVRLQAPLIAATLKALEGKLFGNVLDIGAGTTTDYRTHAISMLVCADTSPESLKRHASAALALATKSENLGLRNNTFDHALLLHTLHHIAGDTAASTRHNLSATLDEAQRVLRNAGKIFIIEAVCPHELEMLTFMFHGILTQLARVAQKPMVHFFSHATINAALHENGFTDIETHSLDTGGALMTPFDAEIGIPFRRTPLRHICIQATKRVKN